MIADSISRRLPVLFVLTVVVVLGITGTLVAATVFWSANEIDIASVQRETRLVRKLLEDRIAQITKDQMTSTTWDVAVKNISPPADADWIDDNLGVWMHDYFGIDRVFIVDGAGHSLYAMIDGQRSTPDAYFSHRAVLEPIIADLRRPDIPAEKSAPAREFVRKYILLENRPAVVSIAPIRGEDAAASPLRGDEPLHIAIRFLDSNFLAELAKDFMILKPRFSWTKTIGPHESSFPLSSSRGDLGYLVWTAQQPGKDIVSRLAPTLLLAACAILILAGFAVLYLDLDRFKAVNDTFGHQAGDELIRQVAERLQTLVQQKDIVARLGGDEFAVLRDSVPAPADVERLAAAILRAIEHPFVLMQQEVAIGISIGAAIAVRGAVNQTDLVRRADVALYRVKNSGRGGFLVFEERMTRGSSQLSSVVH